MLALDSKNHEIIKEIQTYILFEKDFLSEEKIILQNIYKDIEQIKQLRDKFKIKDGKIELRKIDSLNYSDHSYQEIATYVMDKKLFDVLTKE